MVVLPLGVAFGEEVCAFTAVPMNMNIVKTKRNIFFMIWDLTVLNIVGVVNLLINKMALSQNMGKPYQSF